MHKFILAIILTSSVSICQGQLRFPSISAERIGGQEVRIPDAFKGKYSLIGVGSSKKAEDELRTWQVPVYNKFIAKTGLMDGMYDVNVCFLPVFTGAMKAAKKMWSRKSLKTTRNSSWTIFTSTREKWSHSNPSESKIEVSLTSFYWMPMEG